MGLPSTKITPASAFAFCCDTPKPVLHTNATHFQLHKAIAECRISLHTT
jgi:hypothetical protein